MRGLYTFRTRTLLASFIYCNMENYEIGTRIQNVNPDRNADDKSTTGLYGNVTANDGKCVRVRYDNGLTGKTDNPYRYYKIINSNRSSNEPKSMIQTISTFFKNLTVSADDKLLKKHGLMTDNGDFTAQAKEIIATKNTEEEKAYLVELAKKFDAELKAEKE